MDSSGFSQRPLNSIKGPHAGLFCLRRLHWCCAPRHRVCEAGSLGNRGSGMSPTKQMFAGKIDVIKTMEDTITQPPSTYPPHAQACVQHTHASRVHPSLPFCSFILTIPTSTHYTLHTNTAGSHTPIVCPHLTTQACTLHKPVLRHCTYMPHTLTRTSVHIA